MTATGLSSFCHKKATGHNRRLQVWSAMTGEATRVDEVMTINNQNSIKSLAERYRNLAGYFVDHSKAHCAATAMRLANAASILEKKLESYQSGHSAFTPAQRDALEHLLVEGVPTAPALPAQGPGTSAGSAR